MAAILELNTSKMDSMSEKKMRIHLLHDSQYKLNGGLWYV